MKTSLFLIQTIRQKAAVFFACILLSAAFFVTGFLVIYVISPESVYAQQTDTFGLDDTGAAIDLVSGDIRVIAARIIRAALGLLGVVALVIVLYGGFVIMTAGGAADKVEQGKKILINGAIGLGIILSAFTITQFVLTRLQNAILNAGVGSGQDGLINPGQLGFNSYSGSGALGGIVRMHYPERDQKEVPRNASIAVSFNEPMDPGSIIENTNQTCWSTVGGPVACNEQNKDQPYFGDCITGDNATGNPLKDCDNIKTSAVEISNVNDLGAKVKGIASVIYNKDKEVYDFVFDPVEPALLGDTKQAMQYRVNLTSAVKKQGGADAFTGVPNYFWEFETALTADFAPPAVLSVYPDGKKQVARNTGIQIQFSEPINPLTAQGVFKDGGSFFNAILNHIESPGEWRLSNGYQTLEFVSAEECGTNSCGETLYCLPIVCGAGEACNTTEYKVLLRTAELKDPANPNLFEAKPLTGIHDMAGNALDGNANNKAEPRPGIVKKYAIDPQEEKPDNYYWKFTIEDSIDLSAPYIQKVSPALDAENVGAQDTVRILFGGTMNIYSLNSGVKIVESPQATGVDGLWTSQKTLQVDGKTELYINHRDFGPNGQDLFYFVSTNSDVRGMNGNCMYPGRGPYSTKPGESPVCSYDLKTKQATGCVDVQLKSDVDTGCAVPSDAKTGVLQKDVESCISFLQEKVPKNKGN